MLKERETLRPEGFQQEEQKASLLCMTNVCEDPKAGMDFFS